MPLVGDARLADDSRSSDARMMSSRKPHRPGRRAPRSSRQDPVPFPLRLGPAERVRRVPRLSRRPTKTRQAGGLAAQAWIGSPVRPSAAGHVPHKRGRACDARHRPRPRGGVGGSRVAAPPTNARPDKKNHDFEIVVRDIVTFVRDSHGAQAPPSARARACLGGRRARRGRGSSQRGSGSGRNARLALDLSGGELLEARPRRRRGTRRRGCPRPRRVAVRPTRTRRRVSSPAADEAVVSSPTADWVASSGRARRASGARRRRAAVNDARNASITATFATIEVADMLRAWIEHAVFVAGLPNVVVIALDEATLSTRPRPSARFGRADDANDARLPAFGELAHVPARRERFAGADALRVDAANGVFDAHRPPGKQKSVQSDWDRQDKGHTRPAARA